MLVLLQAGAASLRVFGREACPGAGGHADELRFAEITFPSTPAILRVVLAEPGIEALQEAG